MLSAKRGRGTMAERVQYLAVSECYLGREGVDSAYTVERERYHVGSEMM